MSSKRDLSISMARANAVVLFISIPVVVAQFAVFTWLHGTRDLKPTSGALALTLAVILGIFLHEAIHGIGWMIFGRKRFDVIRFGFQWKSLTPYAHLQEPVEVNAYRIGAFLPGFLLGICVYILSLVLGDGNLFWFSLVHTSAAGGDWLILWLLRHVRAGTLVEDHPTNAGCYVIEP